MSFIKGVRWWSFALFLIGVVDKPKAQITPGFIFSNPCAGSEVFFTDQSTTPNNFVSWTWTFGDPSSGALNTSTDQHPNHLFSTAGTYLVKLVVTDDAPQTDSITVSVQILASPAPDFSSTHPCIGVAAGFTDLSMPGAAPIDQWLWSFGDLVTDTIQNPTHLYGAPNTYQAVLSITDTNNCSSSVSNPVKIHAFPVWNGMSDGFACLHAPEFFTEQATVFNGVVNQWNWNFGGLGTDTLKNLYFTFDTMGTFPVLLTVSTDGNCSVTDTLLVTVTPLPVASFSFSPQIGFPPLLVSFSAIQAEQYLWDFGQGNSSMLANPVQTYTDTGSFPVCLQVTDLLGCTGDTVCDRVEVREPVVDVAVSSLSYSNQSGLITLASTFSNLGNFDIYGLEVLIDFGKEIKLVEYLEDTLSPGETIGFPFQTKVLSEPGDDALFVCMEVFPIGLSDIQNSNNKLCRSIGGDIYLSNPFPSPSSTEFLLDCIFPESGQLSVSVFNVAGLKVWGFDHADANSGFYRLSIPVSGFLNGVYFVNLEFEGRKFVRTWVKG